MAVTTTKTNKPLNPRGNDQSPKGYNRASLFSGKALDFDGVNDVVNIGAEGGAYNDFTLVWNLKTSYASDFQSVFSAGNLQDFYLNSTGQFRIFIGASYDTTSLPKINTGEWVNLVFTRSGSTGSFYYNGVLVETLTITTTTLNNTDVRIGTNQFGSYPFNGDMGGFKLFSTALTSAQVSDLYNNPEKIVPTGVEDTALKLWLPMMEGAGTTAYDGSGNGNHGTISGATYVHGVGSPVSQSAVIDWNKGTNLFNSSEQFSSASWAKLNSLPSSEETGVTAPDGNGSVTTRFTFSATNHIIRQYIPDYGGNQTSAGVWVYIENKGTGGTELAMDWGDGTGKVFDVAGYDLNTWYKLEFEDITRGPFNFFDIASNSSGTAPNGLQARFWGAHLNLGTTLGPYIRTGATAQTTPVLLPQGLTSGRDITGVNLFENVRKQGALNLDGNSWAEVHDNASLDITDAVSLEMWIYWEDQSAETTILGKWVGGADRAYALIATTTTGRVDFRQRVSSTTYTMGISTLSNGWNHLVATHDHSANERLGYINGVLVSTATSQGVSNESDNNITIGGISTTQYTNDIAQPRIYNRALTAEEVQRNYNAGKNIYTN